MSHGYVAYGMQLESDFPLPGMRARRDDGLARLRLALGDVSAGPGEHEWSGRLGDGCELRIDRHGAGGARLFSYGDRARFLLAADRSSLRCAPLRHDLHWQRALLTKVLPSVSVMRGFEALHASAVDSPQGVVAIAAPAGMGKSTLALELMRRGWPLLSDDVLVLSHEQGQAVHAHPGTPHMNLDQDEVPVDEVEELARTIAVLAGERWVAVNAQASGPRPVRAVAMLERGPGLSLEVEPLPPSPLPLAPYVLGLAPDAQRRRSRFLLYGAMMGATRLLRIAGSPAEGPAALADALEGALEGRPQTAGCLA